ncbi:MAG: thymidine phosphorylase [Nitrospinae bacterium]|nr:thymidine phosphorylase [Nitrospinota bacterium]
MRTFDIIKKKRDGEILSPQEIDIFIRGLTRGEIPDYQATALLMAIYFSGMTEDETYHLTYSMMNSGEVLDLSDIPGIKVDKHSTGGVGDKLSLTIAPLVASAGIPMPMIAGRGLGHTGGTVDKLESIPNFRTNLSLREFKETVKKINLSIIVQTSEIAPSDKKLYALRDVTATVESIPLIVSSIMSKKLAEGIDGLVMDVKTGNGAFMKEFEDALELSEGIVQIGKKFGKNVVALITDMNQPLGYAVGNSLEVIEVIEMLKGKGSDDIKNLTLKIGAWMLKIGGITEDIEDGIKILQEKLKSGEGLKKFRELIKCQNGNPEVTEDYNLFPKAKIIKDITSSKSGYVQKIETDKIGISASILGAGRLKADSPIDYSAGLILRKKIGDYVEKGESLVTIHTNLPLPLLIKEGSEGRSEAESIITSSYIIGVNQPIKPPLIHKVIT